MSEAPQTNIQIETSAPLSAPPSRGPTGDFVKPPSRGQSRAVSRHRLSSANRPASTRSDIFLQF